MIVFITLILVQLCASESLEEVPIQPRACDGSCDYYQNPNNCAEAINCVDPSFIVPACDGEGLCFDDGPACGCAPERGCPENCQYYQTEETCPQYQNCDHLEAIVSCPAGQCFSELYCRCTSDPVPPIPCTTGCNVYAEMHPDGCLGYRVCETEILYRCPDGLCFDESICACSVDATPNPPGTPATPSPECPCPWLSVPNGNCNGYVDCLKPHFIMSCPEGCFSEEACSCVDEPSTSGPTPTTDPGVTSTAECPCKWIAFPDEDNPDCNLYKDCELPGDAMSCANGLCFSESECACISSSNPSAPITSGTPSCSSCAYMPVGGSCSGYAPCPNGYPTLYCNTGFCFNEDTCSCELQVGM